MMKKILLAVFALMAMTAVAQPTVDRPSDHQATDVFSQNRERQLTVATDVQREAMKVAPKVTLTAWYNRPAGTFFRSIGGGGEAYQTPCLFVPPYRYSTFHNVSTGADSYIWRMNGSAIALTDSTATDLRHPFSQELLFAPALWAYSGAKSTSYSMTNYSYNQFTGQFAPYPALLWSPIDPRKAMTALSNPYDCYVSPKYFAGGNRSGTSTWDVFYVGDGTENGQYFGKNANNFNGMTLYIEKPASRYALRKIVLLYTKLVVTGDADLYAKIYKVNQHDADTLVLGEQIAQAKATLTTSTAASGFLEMPIQDEEDGMSYDVTLDVNEPLAIVVSGYDNANITSFTLMVSGDTYDEGYGQHGYMTRLVDGKVTRMWGLDHFFTTSLGVTAPTVYLDVEWPLLVFQQSGLYKDSIDFAAAGSTVSRVVASSHSSDDWSISAEDGSDLPEWISCYANDSLTSGNYNNLSNFYITAEPLPAGTTGRKCVMKVSVPGTQPLLITCTQGTTALKGDVNGDGKVDASDVAALMNIILNNGTVAENPTGDVNGDGKIDTSDISELITIILNA